MKMIELVNNTPLTSTKVIEFYTEVKHQNILQLFRRHEESIKKFGVIMFEKWKPKKGSRGGRPETFYYLNEEQFTFFIMLMANSEKVVNLKIELNKQFHQLRKALLQSELNKQNEEWLESRKNGKQARKELVDAIEKLRKIHITNKPDSNYAKNPRTMYSNFTRIIDKSLFDIKVSSKNKRDLMTTKQLNNLGVAEIAIAKIIYKAIDNNKDAKETYKLIQNEIEPYVKFLGGKTPIIDVLLGTQISILDS